MKNRWLLGFAVSVLLPVLSFAGVEWETKSVTKIESKESLTIIKGDAQNGNVKEEIIDASDSANPILKKGSYFLYKNGSSNVIVVSPENKTYTEMSLTDMMNAMGEIIQISINNAAVSVTKLADEAILSYPCQHAKIDSAYDMEMKIAFITTKSHVEQSQEIWGTDKIGAKDFADLYKNKSFKSSMKDLDSLIEKQSAALAGMSFPLKSITIQRVSDINKPKNVKTTTTETTVSTIIEKALSDDIFKIPAGYSKTEIAAADTNKSLSEATNKQDKLEINTKDLSKKLLKGLFN